MRFTQKQGTNIAAVVAAFNVMLALAGASLTGAPPSSSTCSSSRDMECLNRDQRFKLGAERIASPRLRCSRRSGESCSPSCRTPAERLRYPDSQRIEAHDAAAGGVHATGRPPPRLRPLDPASPNRAVAFHADDAVDIEKAPGIRVQVGDVSSMPAQCRTFFGQP